jgi:hypothetical protein
MFMVMPTTTVLGVDAHAHDVVIAFCHDEPGGCEVPSKLEVP